MTRRTTTQVLRFTPRRKTLLNALANAKSTGFQTTDGIATHLILNGRAVTEATSADFRAMVVRGLLALDGQRVTVTQLGQDHRTRWANVTGSAAITL
jgi:hypothetical protein